MGNMKMKLLVMGLLLLSSATHANSEKVIRARDMGTAMWSDFSRGKLGHVVVEFRKGDELPMTFETKGDLLEIKQSSVSCIGVKRSFWLRLMPTDIEISFDGVEYKKINEALLGSFEVQPGSAQNGGIADAISVIFSAFIK